MKGKNWLSKIRKENWLILLFAGILLLILAMPESEKKTDNNDKIASSTDSESWTEENYVHKLEHRLEQALCQIEGVGKVSVMITLASSSEKIVEKELETRNSVSNHEESKVGETKDRSEQVVYSSETGEEVPYVKQEISPIIQGVLVIAEGGDNAVIRKDITEVVQALFNVDTHKIRVMKHN